MAARLADAGSRLQPYHSSCQTTEAMAISFWCAARRSNTCGLGSGRNGSVTTLVSSKYAVGTRSFPDQAKARADR